MTVQPEPRYWILDLLRYAASVLVALCHWRLETDIFRAQELQFLDAIAKAGNFGVEVFFIISGFVISLTANRKSSPTSFLWARFTRIFPGLFICMLLILAVRGAGLILPLQAPVVSFLGSVTLTYPLWGVEALTPVLWTLIVEVFFYFWVFCLLLLKNDFFRAPLASSLVFSFWLFLSYQIPPSFPQGLRDFIFLQGYLPCFCLGAGLFFLTQNIQAFHAGKLVWAVSSFLIIYNFICQEESAFKLVIYVFSIVIIFLSPFLRLGSNLFCKCADILGQASYPMYLLHIHVGVGIILLFQNCGQRGWLVVLLSLSGFSLICAFISCFFENPCRKRFLRFLH